MRDAFAVAVGRLVQFAARARGGKGSGVPGLVANRVAPGLLSRVLNGFPEGLVIVSGTAGKSTTTKMLTAVLRAHGLTVFTNSSTANLPQGITSAILDAGDYRGRVQADIAVIEMDEAHGAQMAGSLNPRVVVLTNVMLDDLERFETMDRVSAMLAAMAGRATETVVVNADDASLVSIAESAAERGLRVGRYGVSARVLAAQPRGLGYVKLNDERLQPEHGCVIVDVDGRNATLALDTQSAEVRLPARGTHFAVDAAAALTAAQYILGSRFELQSSALALSEVEPVFGRGERVNIRGQEIDLVLVQNTSSFQLNLDVMGSDHELLLLAIGAEEHDPSWLWTVDPARLASVDIVTGPKALDMAVRLRYAGVTVGEVDGDLLKSFERFLTLPTPPSGRKTVMFTASQMRELRRVYGLVKAELEGGH